ncbi:MAG TPA: aspartate kinase [Nitrospirales bacterium]|nr:aspartate kinase [Nitrospirales bacterium]
MSLVVQKYGGTSVGTVDRIKHIAERIAAMQKDNHRIVVVVSAMNDETDRLMELAREISDQPDQRELDLLLSSGERVTIALVAMTLKEMGVEAQSFTGRQVGIFTDTTHTKARIERISAARITTALEHNLVPVVAGFQGINEQSDVTTLGRGGSDLTAIALAASLHADRCEIYTDVDGVYTADPRIVPTAKRLDRISYEEMLEMASLGAKVLQDRAVVFAANHQVRIVVKSSFTEGPGTEVIKEHKEMERNAVSAVTYDRNQAKVTLIGVPDTPGIAARIFEPVAKADIIVDMIIQNVGQDSMTDVSFTVPKDDVPMAVEVMNRVSQEIHAKRVEVMQNIAKVSLVGVGMRSHSGVAAKMFVVMANKGINIMMISTSEIKISCVIEEKHVETAVELLHKEFELDETTSIQ